MQLKNFRTLLKKLCKSIILSGKKFSVEDTGYGHYNARIPEELDKSNDGLFLMISGDEYNKFQEVCYEMPKVTEFEWMRERDVREEVWYLVCDLWLNRDHYKREAKAVDDRVDRFIDIFSRDVIDFRVIIPIEMLDLKDSVVNLRDIDFRVFDKRLADDIGFDPEKLVRNPPNPLDKTCAILEEKGTSPKLVVERARSKVDKTLEALRFVLLRVRRYHDYQLRFRMGEHSYLHSGATGPLWSWQRTKWSFLCETNQSMIDVVSSEIDTFNLMNSADWIEKSFRDKWNRALWWFGKSIIEEDPDFKILHLSTALESLLCSISDTKKGETLAARSILLKAKMEDSFTHPAKILWLYEKRSRISHGDAIEISTEDDYQSLRYATEDLLLSIAKVCIDEKIGKHTELIQWINDNPRLDDVIKWLDEMGDKYSNAISNHVKGMFGR